MTTCTGCTHVCMTMTLFFNYYWKEVPYMCTLHPQVYISWIMNVVSVSAAQSQWGHFKSQELLWALSSECTHKHTQLSMTIVVIVIVLKGNQCVQHFSTVPRSSITCWDSLWPPVMTLHSFEHTQHTVPYCPPSILAVPYCDPYLPPPISGNFSWMNRRINATATLSTPHHPWSTPSIKYTILFASKHLVYFL